MNDLINGSFIFNQALFSGGAIYADESSTTITADQYNHTSDITLGSCFIRFPSIHENPDVRRTNNNYEHMIILMYIKFGL